MTGWLIVERKTTILMKNLYWQTSLTELERMKATPFVFYTPTIYIAGRRHSLLWVISVVLDTYEVWVAVRRTKHPTMPPNPTLAYVDPKASSFCNKACQKLIVLFIVVFHFGGVFFFLLEWKWISEQIVCLYLVPKTRIKNYSKVGRLYQWFD